MITIALEKIRKNGTGDVTGVIYLHLEDGEFPGKDWSDFPVIILGRWTQACLELARKERRKVDWQFMDGPYTVTLRLVEHRGPSQAISFDQLRDSLLNAAVQVIAECDRRSFLSRDLETLRDNVARLQANKASTGSFVEVQRS